MHIHNFYISCVFKNSFLPSLTLHSFSSAPPAIYEGMPVQDIYFGEISVIKCEVDRGRPLANIHWLRVHYDNDTRQQILTEITNVLNPRFTILSNGLQITNVQLSDEGIYRCYVYNSYGSVIRDIQVEIRGL